MTVQLTLHVQDDLMTWLAATARDNFRTPDQQALWIIHNARSRRVPQHSAAPDTAQPLFDELRRLHAHAGLPSSRVISQRIRNHEGAVSHTTVNDVLSGRKVPSWRVLASILTVLDGDAEHVRTLWAASVAGATAPVSSLPSARSPIPRTG